MDAFLLVQLMEERTRGAPQWAQQLRQALPSRFPGAEFAFDTGGMITAALNYGLPSPIDVQISGNDLEVARGLALEIERRIEAIDGAVDVRIQQKLDYPSLVLDIDRERAAVLGISPEDALKNVVAAVNSSINFDPAFWIDPKNGNHYFLGVQYREQDIDSIESLLDVPISGANGFDAVPLRAFASVHRSTAPAEVSHYNITRVTDVYANVEGRAVGDIAADVERALEGLDIPSGYFVNMRGEVSSMRESFGSLRFGLALATILVYLVLVLQFRSFLDPLVILVAVPLGAIGVVLALRLTATHFSIPAFLGLVFMVGIAVSNSILLVEFTNRLRAAGRSHLDSIIEGALARARPVLMTSLAAVFGLLPLAIGTSHGAEANAPLARAVIGGLIASTALTLVVVPVLLHLVRRRAAREAR